MWHEKDKMLALAKIFDFFLRFCSSIYNKKVLCCNEKIRCLSTDEQQINICMRSFTVNNERTEVHTKDLGQLCFRADQVNVVLKTFIT